MLIGNMTELATDVAANGRRLPTWMLQANTAEKLRKSAKGDVKGSLPEETTRPAAGSRKKSVVNNHDETLTQEAETEQQARSSQGHEATRRIKNTTRAKGPCTSVSTCNGVKEKRKRNTIVEDTTLIESISARRQHVKSKRPTKSDTEVVSPEQSDKEISLTVEDLLSIAQEYVTGDIEKQCGEEATRECTSGTYCSSLATSFKARGSSQVGEASQILKKCSYSPHRIGDDGKERENKRIGNFASPVISTGDVAQDMLNLYLGPFLKMPLHGDQSVQASESKGWSLVQTDESLKFPPGAETESKGLASYPEVKSQALPSSLLIGPKQLPSLYEFNKQLKSSILTDAEVPLMKKKSSLKDKVALFFD